MPRLRQMRSSASRSLVAATVLALVCATGSLVAPEPAASADPTSADTAFVNALPTNALPMDALPTGRDEEVRREASRLIEGLTIISTAVTTRSATPAGQSGVWEWPMAGPKRVAKSFDGPAQAWLPGHRGADLMGYDGVPVTAVAVGVVAYSGTINGTGIISVQHANGLRSTYQPVTDRLPRDHMVRAGQRLGYLETLGSHCWPRACLHLGARRGQVYLDPLLLLGAWEVSLLPTDMP